MSAAVEASATGTGIDRLVLSHFTLDREHPLDDRIRLASAAGYSGIGLFAGQYAALLADGWSPNRVHELLDDAGITIAEVEVLSGWGAHEPSAQYLDFERLVWEMVDEFEVPYVQAIGPTDGTVADAGARFGAVCDRAAEHGATIGLEFLPFTNIVDADGALAVVQSADRPNGGVCADIWHHARGADDLDQIRRILPELLVRVQMSDGPDAPTLEDYKDDCLRYRVAPGSGAFDVDGFVTIAIDAGYTGPWDLEVCNDDVWGSAPRCTPIDHVRRCADGMRDVLGRCRS